MAMDLKTYRIIEQVVDEKIRHITVTKSDFRELKNVVGELAEAQKRTEEKVEELAEAQKRTEIAVGRLAENIAGLSDTIGFTIEDIGRVIAPGYLERHFGIIVDELNRKFVKIDNDEIEFDFYGECKHKDKQITIIGESKTRIYGRDVKKFKEYLKKIAPKIKGEIKPIMVGFLIHPTAYDEAKELNIILIASYER